MGKGGSSTTVEIPAYIEDAAKKNLTRADKISALGSVPLSFGPTAAAFTPMQTSAFTNTADQAMSFGLNAPTGDAAIYGGMDAPTTYANGVSAYSAMPLYNNIMDEFAAARPGQKDYIDSFFIDPFTGAAGYNVGNPVDYTTYTNTSTNTNTGGGSDGGGGGGNDGGGGANVISTVPDDQSTGNFYQDNQLYNPDIDYTDAYVASNNQIVGTLDPSDTNLQIMEDEYGIDPGFYTDPDNPIYSSSDFELGSSTQGTDYTVYDTSDDDNTPTATNQYGSTVSVGYDVGQVDPGLAAAAGYDTDTPPPGVVGNNDSGSNSFAQTMANLTTPNDGTSYVDGVLTYDNDSGGSDDGGGSSDSGSDDDCVIATHAVASGGFTPNMKREAVVWCMHKLHDRWWGEAVRRGYRYLGRKKIEQGKAREHYAEFRRYIDFASGKRRTLRGALTFTLRTAQFFAVGLIRKDA